MIEYPLRHAQIAAMKRKLDALRAWIMNASFVIGQQHDALPFELLADVLDCNLADFGLSLREPELARKRIEHAGTARAMLGNLGLRAQIDGERAYDQADGKHDCERDEVLHVRHCKRIARRHEKEVERRDRQQRCEHRRAAAET